MANAFFGTGGQVVATFLHTVGAIGYLAGIAFFIGWRRSLHRGHHNASVLATGAALAYVSIGANLLGGFIRTYAPGHPSLYQVFDNAWVMVMAIKHLALFAGIFAAVWLFEIVAPRLKKRFDAGELPEAPDATGRLATRTVVLSIVLAGVLGGVTTAIPLGDATQDDDPTLRDAPPEPFLGTRLTFDGSASSTSPDRGSFDVPNGASTLWANLTGGDVGGALPIPYAITLTVTDPVGAQHSQTTPQTGQRTAAIQLPEPLAGPWTYEVSTDGVEAPWSLTVELAGETLREGTVTIPAGAFFEINTQALAGDRLHWDWSADAEVDWNIHTHFDGEVQTLRDGHRDDDAGTLVVQRDGGHSYLWAAEEEATLEYQVWGDFDVDSVVRSWA